MSQLLIVTCSERHPLSTFSLGRLVFAENVDIDVSAEAMQTCQRVKLTVTRVSYPLAHVCDVELIFAS